MLKAVQSGGFDDQHRSLLLVDSTGCDDRQGLFTSQVKGVERGGSIFSTDLNIRLHSEPREKREIKRSEETKIWLEG